jgi:hypothetical protein
LMLFSEGGKLLASICFETGDLVLDILTTHKARVSSCMDSTRVCTSGRCLHTTSVVRAPALRGVGLIAVVVQPGCR